MAYNGYSQYPPYWQQQAGQSSPQSAAQNTPQSRTPYQPLSAYQSTQQPARPPTTQSAEKPGSASYGTEGYGHRTVNGTGNGRPQDLPTSYASTNDRASLDGATALGNLAYASSWSGSAQQLPNYNRQQSSSGYGTPSPYGIGSTPPIRNRTNDDRRKGSSSVREETNAGAQQATASPSFGYSSNSAAHQGPNSGNNTQAQSQYPQPRSVSEQHLLDQYSKQSQPKGDQAIEQPRSRPESQAAPPPTVSTSQSTPYQSYGKKVDGNLRETAQTQSQTPQQSTYRPTSSHTPGPPGVRAQRPQAEQSTHEMGTKSLANRATKSKAAVPLSVEEMASKRVNDARQSPIVDANRQASKPGTPVEPQYSTVDPSQVFNHVEYSRRQAAAAAEAAATKKAVEQAEAARNFAKQTNSPKINGSSAVASAPGMEPDLVKKDQMELEMKQMIEKMRDYKAKDPSLFTQIWEQVKKSQPPQSAPSQSLQGSTASPTVVNGQLPSPSLIQNQLPRGSDLLASDEFPPNFDRGRFPAQRRRRGGSTKTATSRKSSTPSTSTKPVNDTQSAEDRGSPVAPEIAIPTPKIGQIFPDPRSQSMQEAVQQYQQNSKLPVTKAQNISGSNEQAMTSPPKAKPSTAAPSQPVPAQSAPPPKPGGTYWPESKKRALAEAARVTLTSTFPNQGKTITTQEIHELLDQNPSYIQMCEILEYRGFIIDRGQFARTLLKAVPDLGTASRPANATGTDTASANRTMPTQATPPITTSDTTATKSSSATTTPGSFGKLVKATPADTTAQKMTPQPLPYTVPPKGPFQAPNAYTTPHASTPPSADQIIGGNQSNGLSRDYRFVDPRSWTPDVPHHPGRIMNHGWQEPGPHPHPSSSVHQQSGSMSGQVSSQNGAIHPDGVIPHPTKQEMARKRTFDEIVDLTQAPDEEELERHRLKPLADIESTTGPSRLVKSVFDPDPRRQQNSGRSTPKPFKYKYSGRDALLQSYDIVQPMNKRRDALRRSSYNPKTIARDILLGIGKHPHMLPLNAHLDVLKDRFKAVDNDSNLSTFRWDLVDPEDEAKTRAYDTDDEEAVPTASAKTQQHPAPMAIMANSDGGNFSRNAQTSSPMDSRTKQFKSGSYNEIGIRSYVRPIGSEDTSERYPPQSPPFQDFSKVAGITPPDLSRFEYNSPYLAQAEMSTPDVSHSGSLTTSLKRKGRRPGSKNKQVRPDKGRPRERKTSPMGAKQSIAKETALDGGTVGTRTPPESPSNGKPSAHIPTRPRINTTTPSRPSGLRNSISAMTPTDGIAIIIPSRSPSVVITPQSSARRGRPKRADDRSSNRSEDRSNGSPSSAHVYTMYRCRWERCPAELHNLETLKKHIKKHCRAVDDVYPCLWADCSDSSNPISNNTQNEAGQNKRSKFKTDTELFTHVENSHLKTGRELSA